MNRGRRAAEDERAKRTGPRAGAIVPTAGETLDDLRHLCDEAVPCGCGRGCHVGVGIDRGCQVFGCGGVGQAVATGHLPTDRPLTHEPPELHVVHGCIRRPAVFTSSVIEKIRFPLSDRCRVKNPIQSMALMGHSPSEAGRFARTASRRSRNAALPWPAQIC